MLPKRCIRMVVFAWCPSGKCSKISWQRAVQMLYNHLPNTPFTQGLRPLCLPCATTNLARSPLKVQRRPNGCLGRSRVVHRTLKHRHGRHGRREVLSMFKTVAQRSPRRSVARRSLKRGRRKAHASPLWQNGRTVVGIWSPRKKVHTVLNIVYQFERSFCLPWTIIVPPLTDQWRPLSDHCGDHCASIRRLQQPLSHLGNGSASTLPPLCDLSCHYSRFGRSGVVLQ